jgi:type II secretion system protein H
VRTLPVRLHRNATGMTLLEVLVVITIMALIMGIAGLSFQGGGQRQARFSGEKLAAQINHAALLSTLRGHPIGLALSNDRYQFMVREQNQQREHLWRPAQQRGLNKENRLPKQGRLQLSINSSLVGLDAEPPVKPQLLIPPSGELPDFEIVIDNADGNAGYRVSPGPSKFKALLSSAADH